MTRHLLLPFTALAVLFFPGVAVADDHAADTKFQEALTHFKAQDYKQACPEFEESERLEPSPSTEYFLAKCAIEDQHFARAWNLFKRAASTLAGARERAAAEQAAADVASKVGLVTLVGTQAAPNLEVHLDADDITSQVLLGAPVAVDPGPHQLRAIAPNRSEWHREFAIAKGESLNFSVPALPSVESSSVQAVPPLATPGPANITPGAPPAYTNRRRFAYIAGGIGVAGAIAGGLFGGIAAKEWSDAQRGCVQQRGAFVSCPPGADSQRQTAGRWADASTASFAVAGVGLATAAYLYFTEPERHPIPPAHYVRIVPELTPATASISVTGQF